MLRVLIVDDEELARRGLEIRLEKYADIEICGLARNGREALLAVREQAPDLLFLDVQMPGMDGFDVLRCLAGRNMPEVIFVTAYDEFALKAFDANALDYLLKPINDERLRRAVERARRHADEMHAEEHRNKLLKFVCELTGRELTLDSALEAASGEHRAYPRRIAIRDGAETQCVDVKAIDWIDAAGDYMCVHAAGDTFVLRGTMKHLEGVLDPETFVRVHRSAIVNRHRVTAMRPHRNGEYFLQLGDATELKLSRKYKGNLERLADHI
ncbi:MAG: LytTR family DNA-binding domain-containing protein [Gammaproteobacteria bacterium]|nr:LytTR family DNA-binding domain-containing protein [Gammaproteobacteria bacterium]